MVEGPVIGIEKSAVYVDLPPFGTGIIYGREYITARDLVRNLHAGDTVSAKIVDIKNEEGYIELSLKEARALFQRLAGLWTDIRQFQSY